MSAENPKFGWLKTKMANAELGCGHCNKQEDASIGFKLKPCSGCASICYCDTTCQRADWKKHKVLCKSKSSAMKMMITDHHINNSSSNLSITSIIEQARLKREPVIFTFASAYGSTSVMFSPVPSKIPHAIEGKGQTHVKINFSSVEELRIDLSFLVSCLIGDLELAKNKGRDLLSNLGRKTTLNDIRFPGSYINGLDIASRKGHYNLIDWLMSDTEFKPQFESPAINASEFPNVAVAWALYANKVDVAKLLVRHGCNPMATSHHLYGYLPGFFMAAQNLSMESIQYCVEELNIDVNMILPEYEDVERPMKERHILWHCKDIRGAKGVYGTDERFEQMDKVIEYLKSKGAVKQS